MIIYNPYNPCAAPRIAYIEINILYETFIYIKCSQHNIEIIIFLVHEDLIKVVQNVAIIFFVWF